MLRFLKIRHLAVIDAVEVEFDPGLNVLTGETGAGKSILVEAVSLLLGRPRFRRPRSNGRGRRDHRSNLRDMPDRSCWSGGRSRPRAAAARSSTARSRRRPRSRISPSSLDRASRPARASDAAGCRHASGHPGYVWGFDRKPDRGCRSIRIAARSAGGVRTSQVRAPGSRGAARVDCLPARRTRAGGSEGEPAGRRRRARRAEEGACQRGAGRAAVCRGLCDRCTKATGRFSRDSPRSGGESANWRRSTRSSSPTSMPGMASSRSSKTSRRFSADMRTASKRRRRDFSRSKSDSRSSSGSNESTGRRSPTFSPGETRSSAKSPISRAATNGSRNWSGSWRPRERDICRQRASCRKSGVERRRRSPERSNESSPSSRWSGRVSK